MFGLSLAETAVIIVVAIVVIGPKELPTVIRAVIRTVGQLRSLGSEFRRNFDELARETELQELHKDLRDQLDKELVDMPTIIDMEGNEQRTYDISGELKADTEKRRPKPGQKPEGGDE